MLKEFGWTYDYLLWGISWLNLQLMIADQARIINNETTGEDGEVKSDGKVEHLELKSKEDIKNYIKGLM